MEEDFAWLDDLKARGWGSAFSTVLDVIEPVAPLAAQMCWVLQPAAAMMGAADTLRDLAQALETPDGITALRHHLEDTGE